MLSSLNRTLQSAPLCQQPEAWSAYGQGRRDSCHRGNDVKKAHRHKAKLVKCAAMGKTTNGHERPRDLQASANDTQLFRTSDVGRAAMLSHLPEETETKS